MARNSSAKKRVRQNEARRQRNRSRASRTRSAVKAVVRAAAGASGEAGEKSRAEALYRRASSELDRASKRRVIHPNAAARTKSRLAKRLRKAFAAGE